MELKTVLSIEKKETKWILATTNETCIYTYFFPKNGWKSKTEAVVSCFSMSRTSVFPATAAAGPSCPRPLPTALAVQT